ncbi:two-component regulator propeller domain-containing protein [Pedobacter aquatilis]|uniref:sensor histidine kinase n=1 Tax=Pedobacter aquatilis TaxID=351343 RepID=UPI0025B30CC3|nr:two-component regulator propeller domain-containing protein [Pedobacter aquatilis]MDN3588722.1 two-component regulator propeller domain-containing protein [Pedobacter aquatilis]
MESISNKISAFFRRNVLQTVLLFFCAITIFATPVKIAAQTTYLPHYTSKNGLSSNNCYYIHQDKKGFIWIATDAGLSRFDGTNFQNFTIEDGLPDTQILQIKEDSKGKLWFLALNGQLSYLKDGKFYNRNNSNLLNKLNFNTVIVSFLEDKKGRIWLGTNSNLIVLWDGKSIKKFVSPNKKQQFTNAFLHEDEAGDIYSYSDESTQKFSGNSFAITNNNVNPLSYMTAFNAPNRSLYYLNDSGLNQYQNGKIKSIIRIPDNLLKNMSGYFYYDVAENEVWLASSNGALVLNKSGKTVMYLQGISVNQSIKDNSNNMWFATNQGIYMLPNVNSRLSIIDAESGLSSNVIKSIAKDSKNRLWLGTDDAVIDILNINNFEIDEVGMDDYKKYKTIKQITYDPKNQSVYFASDYGLGVFNNIYKTKDDVKYLKETNNSMFVIKHFSLCNQDNHLAIALSSGVVFLSDRINELEFNSLKYKEKEDFFKNRSYHVFYDKSGSLWFSNINGLFEFSKGVLIHHYKNNPLLTKRINDIQQLADGTLVLATDGYGILFYRNNKIVKQLTIKDGLTNDICTKLFIKNNEIWAITNKGVNKISNYEKSSVTNFDYGKDLLTEDVNNLYIDDSTAYFATNKGLILFKYNNQNLPKSLPKVYITSIIKDKERLSIDKDNFTFESGNNTILFTFGAVDFTTSDITYRYRLNENSTWVETRTRRLDFSALQAGEYHFEVSAKTQNNAWGPSAKIAFTIKAHFWQSFWFLSLVILLVGYVFYRLAVYITRRQKDKEQEQLLLKNRILMLEQQALQAMMNPHFVFNVMNSIQHFINTQNTTSANKILTGFARLIRKNLEICTKSYITIDEELEYLNLYLKLEKNRFGDKLKYIIYVDESIDKDETLIPSMLLQPYVENAIWHGIMPKESGGEIQINIKTASNSLNIEIIDDGVGIENSLKAKKDKHISKGMQLTKERLNLLGQIEAKPIQLNVYQNTTNGTSVFISIPMK